MPTKINLFHPQFSSAESEQIEKEIKICINHYADSQKASIGESITSEFDFYSSLLWQVAELSVTPSHLVSKYLYDELEPSLLEEEENKAMVLLIFQVASFEQFLNQVAQKDLSSHRNDGTVFALGKVAGNLLKMSPKSDLEKTTASIRKEPYEIIENRLSQVKCEVSEDESKLNLALLFLLKRFFISEAVLKKIQDGNLVCCEHHAQESSGKTRLTAQEVARNAWEQLHDFQFERVALNFGNPVIRGILEKKHIPLLTWF